MLPIRIAKGPRVPCENPLGGQSTPACAINFSPGTRKGCQYKESLDFCPIATAPMPVFKCSSNVGDHRSNFVVIYCNSAEFLEEVLMTSCPADVVN
jgi:hypothetical protein